MVYTLLALLLLAAPIHVQTDEFPMQFPLEPATDAQVTEAVECELGAENAEALSPDPTACEIANAALALAGSRGDDVAPSDEEIEHFINLVIANPALPQRLDLIATYFGQVSLIVPPDFTEQAIVEIDLRYTFAGLGDSVDYHLNLTDAHLTPVVTGEISRGNYFGEDDPTPTPMPLPETVDAELLQAFGPALSDLLPIGSQFNIINCTDYYPDWTVQLTFEDGTQIEMVTNRTNVIGLGGPWQTVIDEQVYMQYSSAFQEPIVELFEALNLPFGQTAGMYCGGISDPIHELFPRTTEEPEA